MKTEGRAGLVPELVAIRRNLGGGDTIEHDDAIRLKYLQNLLHDRFQMSSMPPDEYGIRTRQTRDILIEEITHVNLDARSPESVGILLHDGLALRTDFEGANLKMGELQARLDTHASCTEADVPKHASLGQIQGLEREQTDGHLGDHLLSSVEQCELGIWYAEIRTMRIASRV